MWYNKYRLVIYMNYEIVTADVKDKDKLYRLLQYALYDGSQYIDNEDIEKIKNMGFNVVRRRIKK